MATTVLRNHASQSAKKLAQALGASLAYVDAERRCRGARFVINWGVSATPQLFRQGSIEYSNTPEAIALCRDKVLTLGAMRVANVSTLEYGIGYSVAEVNDAESGPSRWLAEDGKIVIRHTVTGHSGAGIEVFRKAEEGQQQRPIPAAPLYTRYFKKDAEYRVHVAFGRVILIQQKRKRDGFVHEGDQHLIRTHSNGYVFTVNDLSCDGSGYTTQLGELAVAACNAVGAGHCAVDVLARHGKTFPCGKVRPLSLAVCEINSAPALDAESSLNAYVLAFKAKLGRV